MRYNFVGKNMEVGEKTKEKIGRNPQTGQQCIIPEHENMKFVASELLTERIKERGHE